MPADSAAGGPAAAPPPLLEARGLTHRFPGVLALDNVDFELRAGEIHALLGENGAGKSTLIKLLTGVHRCTRGIIRLDGRPIAPRDPLEAQALGISTVYQEINLIPDLSIAENLVLGRMPRRWGLIRWRASRAEARSLLDRLGLRVPLDQPLRACSLAVQQMIAIARALAIRARVLILDEPTSSLAAEEVRQLFALMRRLRADGLGVIFITHFLGQVYEISDRLTVLRNGRRVGTYTPAELPRLELVAKMLGKPLAEVDGAAVSTAPGAGDPRQVDAPPAEVPPLLSARRLGRRGRVAPLDLEIRAGEIVGLAGLLGSGRTETVRLLFGLDRPDSGEIRLDGRPVRIRSPRRASALRLGFCPEDRQAEGLAPELSVQENVVLALQARRGWHRPLGRRRSREIAAQAIADLRIAAADRRQPVAHLSGGNQQKVILARWLAAAPRLLIVDEPTRGIDVGAKTELERLLASLARGGMAILFISSELEEVVRNCRRVIVLREGVKVGELAGEAVQLDEIMRRIARQASDA